MGLSNDERGWVMTSLSGIGKDHQVAMIPLGTDDVNIACVVGASIICVDILIRQFPGKQNFRIQDSDTFLSASLSLSFGVMVRSRLINLLPLDRTRLSLTHH